MTKIKVKTIIWEEWNVKHIKKHSVTESEVRSTALNFTYHEKTHNGRYLIVGRCGLRILTLIVRRLESGKYYLVTARDSSKKERKKLYEKEN